MMTNNKKWFMGIAIFALIWNALGVMAYLAQVYMTDDALSLLPLEQQELYKNVPTWVTAAFAIAVFGGALGSLLLVLKKKLATNILTISLVGVIVQMVYNFFLSKTMDVYGPGALIMPIMVLIIAFFLVWYSKKSTINGWIS